MTFLLQAKDKIIETSVQFGLRLAIKVLSFICRMDRHKADARDHCSDSCLTNGNHCHGHRRWGGGAGIEGRRVPRRSAGRPGRLTRTKTWKKGRRAAWRDCGWGSRFLGDSNLLDSGRLNVSAVRDGSYKLERG